MTYNTKTKKEMSSQRLVEFSYGDDDQVSVIRREFVALTGDHFSAVVLNQLLYWTLRVKGFDLYLEEERTHGETLGSFQHGWIYKTATDLNEETMLGITHPTIRKYLKLLIDQGWIEEKINSLDKWNKTTKYRVNIRNLQTDLIAIGRQLPGIYLKAFSIALGEKHPHKPQRVVSLKVSNVENRQSTEIPALQSDENSNESSITSSPKSEEISNVSHLHSGENPNDLSAAFFPKSEETPNVRILPSDVKNLPSDVSHLQSNVSSFHSDVKNLHSYTYTENTTENTNREHTQRTRAREDFDKIFFEEVLGVWKTCTSQEAHLTEERKHRLQSVLGVHFQNDLNQWKQFCERVSRSPFLMGQGARKWRVSLDWILVEENLLKVLEGNFDDPAGLDQKRTEGGQTSKEQEIHSVLASIADPVWKEWCSQLDFSLESRDPVSLGELKAISNARFLEAENGRLIWIGSQNPQVLSRIEDLKFKILPVVQRTFPQAHVLRIRLCPDLIVAKAGKHVGTLPITPIQQEGENHAE